MARGEGETPPMPESVLHRSQDQPELQAGNYVGYLYTEIGSMTPRGEFGYPTHGRPTSWYWGCAE